MSEKYDFDPDFLRELIFGYSSKKQEAENIDLLYEEQIKSVKEKIETKLAKASIVCLAEMLLEELHIESEASINDFADAFINRCKAHNISITDGLMFFTESLIDLAKIVGLAHE